MSLTQSPPVTVSKPSDVRTLSETWTSNMTASSSDQITLSKSRTEELFVTTTRTQVSHATLTGTFTLSKEPSNTMTYYHDSSTRQETRSATQTVRLSPTRTLIFTATATVTPTMTLVISGTDTLTDVLSSTDTLKETWTKTLGLTLSESTTVQESDSGSDTMSSSPSDTLTARGAGLRLRPCHRVSCVVPVAPRAGPCQWTTRAVAACLTLSDTRSLPPTPTQTSTPNHVLEQPLAHDYRPLVCLCDSGALAYTAADGIWRPHDSDPTPSETASTTVQLTPTETLLPTGTLTWTETQSLPQRAPSLVT